MKLNLTDTAKTSWFLLNDTLSRDNVFVSFSFKRNGFNPSEKANTLLLRIWTDCKNHIVLRKHFMTD